MAVETIRQEADMNDIMRYFAQGYELGDGELLDVKWAMTADRRVWLQLSVRYEDVATPTPAPGAAEE